MDDDCQEDFNCITKVSEAAPWNHYIRFSNQGYSCQVYQATVMPFRIIWRVTGELKVDQLIRYTQHSILEIKPILKLNKATFEEFVRTTNRFNNLKAFS